MTADQEERLVCAFEQIGANLAGLYALDQARFCIAHPQPKERHESTVTHVQTPEERLREEQGQSEESIEEWVGLREERFRRETEGEESGEP